jgi:hypothetical protein
MKQLRRKRDILKEFKKSLRQVGLVGDTRVAQLLFLSLVSHLLPKPVSMVIKGPSGSGKSYVLELVLKYFPEPGASTLGQAIASSANAIT